MNFMERNFKLGKFLLKFDVLQSGELAPWENNPLKGGVSIDGPI